MVAVVVVVVATRMKTVSDIDATPCVPILMLAAPQRMKTVSDFDATPCDPIPKTAAVTPQKSLLSSATSCMNPLRPLR